MCSKFGVFLAKNTQAPLTSVPQSKTQLVSSLGSEIIIQQDVVGGSDIGCSDDAIFIYVDHINA